jgi:hypothetical protein
LSINITTLKHVLAKTGIDLLDVEEGRAFKEIANPYKLGDVLFVLCKQQADNAGVSDEAFGAALAGDATEKASDALVDEMIDFFPQSRREILRELITRGTALLQSRQELLRKQILNGEIERRFEASIQEELGNSSSNSPAASV